MSRGVDAVLKIAAATDGTFSADALGRYARYLREAERDEWPFTIRRGGRHAERVQRHHAANLLMAMAAGEAHEATRGPRALRPLLWTGRTYVVGSPLRSDSQAARTELGKQVKQVASSDSTTFGHWLEQVIETSANASLEEHDRLERLQVWLSLRPARAEMSWKLAGGGTLTDVFSEPGAEASPRSARRVLVLSYSVIKAAAEVWADTVRAGRAVQPDPPSTTEGIEHAD